MSRGTLWTFAKALEGVGMVIVLVGVMLSINLGVKEGDSLASMKYEMQALGIGGMLFLLGYVIERRLGAR